MGLTTVQRYYAAYALVLFTIFSFVYVTAFYCVVIEYN